MVTWKLNNFFKQMFDKSLLRVSGKNVLVGSSSIDRQNSLEK